MDPEDAVPEQVLHAVQAPTRRSMRGISVLTARREKSQLFDATRALPK
jgi:hypothetical protein